MPAVELVAVVECAGNGRGFYEPAVPGLQWTGGSVGNGRWRGVRLADVLKRAGIKIVGESKCCSTARTRPWARCRISGAPSQ